MAISGRPRWLIYDHIFCKLYEMTVFPKGKHDDQVDSTAQFLDWFKRPFPGQGFYELTRMQAERYRNPRKERERHRVLLVVREVSPWNDVGSHIDSSQRFQKPPPSDTCTRC